jgi:hypothetical protein
MVPADAHWHALPADEVMGAVDTRSAGLSAAEAEARLAAIGPNRVAPAPPERVTTLVWRQLSSPLILVLMAAAAPRSPSARSPTGPSSSPSSSPTR